MELDGNALLVGPPVSLVVVPSFCADESPPLSVDASLLCVASGPASFVCALSPLQQITSAAHTTPNPAKFRMDVVYTNSNDDRTTDDRPREDDRQGDVYRSDERRAERRRAP